MNGKGDTPRPLSISQKEFENNWERIFNTKETNNVTSKRSEVDITEHPRVDEDGNPIEWTAC
jgi:hypothetical protein